MPEKQWDIFIFDEVQEWLDGLDDKARTRIDQTIDLLVEHGPHLSRPTVDTLKGSKLPNLKELRSGSNRILFAFDPWRCSVLLVAGNKAGKWNQWYKEAVPLAEQRYDRYLTDRRAEEESR
ncbi:type II toxin-antitoxin system RelE/ParE family toxin [Glycomyces buryatensis]|uniref:DNA-binding protein n=1 Tax=Glycomyces buryatensis TaxID=2570927 RepID=A0A4S8QCM9_9ACTN|nr:type II toxin-antitoxin system RelE/ParE family toxin [Glycomyces buryatensis]THV42287.1 DNA-binding protein [Glycomyces buryatensis]